MLCYVTTTFDGKERHSAFDSQEHRTTMVNNGQAWFIESLPGKIQFDLAMGLVLPWTRLLKQSIWPGEAGGATFAFIPVCPDPFVAGPIPCGNSTKIKFQQISIKILLWHFTKLKKTASVSLVAIEWAINLTESEWEYDINCQNFDLL